MTILKMAYRAAFTLVLAVALADFFAEPAQAASYCDDPAEQTKIEVMGDWLPWGLQGPVIAGNMLGIYEEEGLEVTLRSPPTGADTIKLVATGTMQFAFTYVPEILMAQQQGLPVVSIAALYRDLVNGLEIPGDSGMKGPADLKGKTIGVNNFPSPRAEVLTLLASAGLTEDDVTLVDPGYGGWQLLMNGKIDANWGLTNASPYLLNSQLAAIGKPPIDFWSYKDHGVPNYYTFVFGANEDWIKENPAATCRFLRATMKGLEAYQKDPERIIKEIYRMSDHYTYEEQWNMSEASWVLWYNDEGETFTQEDEVWKEARDWALESGVITTEFDTDAYFTNEYLPD